MKKETPGAGACMGLLETVFADKSLAISQDTTNVSIFVEFQCSGLARFLSHSELLRILTRACVRANLALKYSQGFNPRPRLSVPLPKAVGLDSSGDVLCFQLAEFSNPLDINGIGSRLKTQVPEGISILSVYMHPSKRSLQPTSAMFTIPLEGAHQQEALQNKINTFIGSTRCIVTRSANPNKTKQIEIRQYVSSIHATEQGIDVTCLITPKGSVRIDEILSVLEINREALSGPIQRKRIQWQLN